MDDATEELGTGLWGTAHHVRRADAGIVQSALFPTGGLTACS